MLGETNAGRSQIAEGLLRAAVPATLEIYSAGRQPKDVEPAAIIAMSEIGIDISGQRAKHINDLRDLRFDVVVHVCRVGIEERARVSGRPIEVDWSLPESADLTETDRLAAFRLMRDELLPLAAAFARSWSWPQRAGGDRD